MVGTKTWQTWKDFPKLESKFVTKDQLTQADAAFAEQCRRQLARPLAARIRYGFNRVHKPVLDDAPWRSCDTMAEYLGFKPVKTSNETTQ